MTEFGPPETFGRVTFCDDIRTEIDGKFTLVGCYGADMVFNVQLPTILPKLGIVVQFIEKLDASKEPIRLEIFFPGDAEDKPGVVSEIPVINSPTPPELFAARDDDTRFSVSLNMVLSPVNIQSVGYIEVKLIKGQNRYRIGRLRVSQAVERA